MIAEFEIKQLPDLPNKTLYRHWRVRHKNTVKWKKLIFHECEDAGILNLNLEKAKITLERHSNREPDFDGIVMSFKPVLDGLVEAGVIVDDKSKVIGQPSYKWVKRPSSSGGMIKVRVEVE